MYKRLIQATANKIGKYYSDMQSRYDEETEHGANLESQSRWDELIRNEMNKLELEDDESEQDDGFEQDDEA